MITRTALGDCLNPKYRQYRVHYFRHFGGPGIRAVLGLDLWTLLKGYDLRGP